MLSTADVSDNDSSLLHTDSDMGLEDQIEQLQHSLNEYVEKTSTFKLGNTNHNINDKASNIIFEATGPNK